MTMIPSAAKDVVQLLEPDAGVKWYQEQRLEGISYEAKYKFQSRLYSVEFNQDGFLEDVEIELNWKEVPQPASGAMKAHFDSTYLRHRVRKVQEQFSGSLAAIRNQMQRLTATDPVSTGGTTVNVPPDTETGEPLVLRYEVVVQVRTAQGPVLHEVLFDEQGRMLQTATILLRNTDNLAY